MKKRELEAMHQLSKNMYTCIGDQWSIVTKREQLNSLFTSFNLAK
jgi:hypothetical protein